MCLMQSVDEGLEPSKVANHLEDPQNPHDPQQPDDLPRLPDDVQVLKSGQEDGEEVGNQGDQVHLEYRWTIHLYEQISRLYQVHSILDKLFLVRRDQKSGDILHKEETDGHCVKRL